MGQFIDIRYDGRDYATFDAAVSDIMAVLEQAPDRAAQRVSGELKKALQRVAEELAKTHSAPWNGRLVNPSDKLQKRSGGGLKSILDSIRVSGGTFDNLEASISTGTMTIHETGGVISARSGKYLTIPLPEACDSRGVPLKRSAREWQNTFVARSRAGNLIIFQRRGAQVVPLYVLKPSVKIRPRLGMAAAFMREVPYFQERLIDLIAQELKL